MQLNMVLLSGAPATEHQQTSFSAAVETIVAVVLVSLSLAFMIIGAAPC
jgi:hypothetical protein